MFTSKEQLYWIRRLHDYSNDSRKLWRCCDEILQRSSSPAISSTTLTAQVLDSFFLEKVARVRSATLSYAPTSFIGPCLNHFNAFQPYTLDEIRRIILESPRKSCQLDPLPYSLYLGSLDYILPLIHITSNNSLQNGALPDCKKLATITTNLKKPDLDPDSVTNL